MPRISIGDCNLHVERHGAGFPVLFISGLIGTAGYWQDHQLTAFSREFDTVLYDHRGIGRSDAARAPQTVDAMAADAIALLDALGIQKAHIVGHSTGAAIAQTIAIEHPNRVEAMVLAAAWMKPDAYLRRLFMLRKELLTGLGPTAYVQASNLLLFPPEWIAANNEALRGQEAQQVANFPPVEIMASRIDALLAFDRSKELGRVKAPTLVVGAADDIEMPAYYSEALARAIPDAELKLFPSGGHCFNQVMPREFNQAVMPFLQAHTAKPKEALAS